MEWKYLVWLLPYLYAILRVYDCNVCSFCDCNNQSHVVDCSNKKLTSVPENPPENTVVLNMSFNNLSNLGDSAFKAYAKLEVLDLSNSRLANISEKVFKGLPSLKVLDLSMNALLPFTENDTHEDLFIGLSSVFELKIFGTTVAYRDGTDNYPGKALAKLPNLRTLWVDGMRNTPFGESFKAMSTLTSIYLPGERTINWRFCYQPNLVRRLLQDLIYVEQFTMRRCAIKTIENDSFVDMIQLRELDLSNNVLLSIDTFLKACDGLSNTRLEVLRINALDDIRGSCGIWLNVSMTQQLGKLTNLKTIYIEQDKINGFEIGALEKLPKSLMKVGMKMNFFDFGFYVFETFKVTNLRWLDLSFNHFPDAMAIWHHTGLDTDHISNADERVMDLTNVDHGGQNKLTFKETQNRWSSDTSKNGIVDEYVSQLFSSNSETSRRFTASNGVYKAKNVCPCQIKLPPETVTMFLPRDLHYLDISNSKLAHPIPGCSIDENNNLQIINASRSLLYCWDGPIHGLKRLEYLDLSLNMCNKVNPSFFDTVPSLKTLSIANNFLDKFIHKDKHGRLFKRLSLLETLDMSRNHLKTVPKRFLINQKNLTSLNLSHNYLKHFDIQIHHFEYLRRIDLTHNRISTLSVDMRQNLTRLSEEKHKPGDAPFDLNLSKNDLHCFCNNLEFLKWVYDHMSTCSFLDIKVTHCIYVDDETKRIHNRTDMGTIINKLDTSCRSYTLTIAATSVAFCVFVIIFATVLGYRLRWKMTYWYYVKSHDLPKPRLGYYAIDDRRNFKFDIYVSSLENARSFVIDQMKPALIDNNFKVFLQDDDIVPGQNMYCMIANAIHVSRVVVFIVSDRCDEDREWQIAMRMAHEESLSRGYPMFFGVFIGDHINVNETDDIRELRRRQHLVYQDSILPINEGTFWIDIVQCVNDFIGNNVFSMTE